MTFSPSIQQAGVLDFVKNGSGNAFVEAVAGAGKTTTLIECVALMAANPRNSIAYAAYNKKIADEVKAKLEKRGLLSRNVQVGTFHSFGYNAWRRAHPGVQLKDKEKWLLIREHLAEKLQTQAQATALEKSWDAVRKMVGFAKGRALDPSEIGNDAVWHDMVQHYNLEEEIENPDLITPAIWFAKRALRESIEMGDMLIDFDDMLYLPVISGTKVWQNDWLLVDEAQDTNPVRRMLARMMVKPRWGRSIFVGDRFQAIYGFTGADAKAVDQIITDFGAIELPLTVTYRCPQAVVTEARRYVDHIQAHESAPVGSVRTIDDETFGEVVPGPADAILCRNTKPLVALAFSYLRRGIPCHIEGKDLGAGLAKFLKKWKIKEVPRFLEKLEDWTDRQVNRKLAKGDEYGAEQLRDQIETLRLLCEGCAMVSEVEVKINTLFKDDEPNLTLCTIHRSKGREWGNVYLYGYNRYLPSPYAKLEWMEVQERNLAYVGITRAQETLTHVIVPFED